MKIDYSKWNSRLLSVEKLKLDVKNPRFSYQSTREMNQTEIIKFLIDNYSVYELAKSISINGYLLNEEPIVCKEGDSYVVLEGNRRIAACKILLNPYKYLSNQRAKELSKNESIPEKIRCHIAPTRREADTLIYNKHTGIPLQKWDKVSQDAFLIELINNEKLSIEEVANKLSVPVSEIRKALRRYSIHQYSIKLFSSESYELELIKVQGFPITNFERFYDDERGLDFLGLQFGSNGEIIKRLPEEEFDKRFRFIVNQILSQDLTSRTFNNEKDKQEYFQSIKTFDKDKFDLDIQVSSMIMPEKKEEKEGVNIEKDEEVDKNGLELKTKSGRRKVGLFSDYDWSDTGVKKIDALFKSIQELNYKKHTDMAGIILRCYVDMLIYEFLKRKKQIGELNKYEIEKSSSHNDKKFNELKKYIKTSYSLSDDEINEEELRSYTRYINKEEIYKIPELGNMVNYIIKHPILLENNSRLIQVLENFKKNNNGFIDLTKCNMFVHNQYYSADIFKLESCVKELSPVLDAMYIAIKNES